jgi:NADP-dependent 3-hydroxy acid dehydrogenase YdfG
MIGSDYTLVLGGSAGIGFAFAEWCARKSQRLVVVGRHRPRLQKAGQALLAAGADEVICIGGDVLDPRFRSKLLSQLTEKRISTVFIGGPSPPARGASTVDWRSLQQTSEICLVYPVHILSSILAGGPTNVHFIFLSSSAARERLENHPFFLSASLRRTAEVVLKNLVAERSNGDISLSIWRPKVVYTNLAKRYAHLLPARGHGDSPLSRLERRFGVLAIPSPEEFVRRMMRTSHD